MRMNMEQARFNMIEQQIRTWDVLDPAILSLLGRVRREDFVPLAYRKLAFADINIPLGHGQVMMQPKLEARLVQALEIKPDDLIL
ncbi:MAG TPA: protein-L-isoaspartate O-methyltransferase, partial [Gammaproteobacteria bacterium]|nr:protein-L-isoaspartate O-methyltransferase [Gammaproteobacteria bacterium]